MKRWTIAIKEGAYMPVENFEDSISAVRRFNRFFTRQIGVLREGLLHSPYSLTEARIIYELAHGDVVTAADLGRELGLDTGYLSRIVSRLEQQGLLARLPSESDGRQRLLRLTPAGEQAFALLDQRARDEVAEMLHNLSEEEQQRLLTSMQTIESVFDKGKSFKF